MLKTLRSVMAILLAVSLLASCAFATSATIDEEGYLEEILLEDGEQLDQYTGEVDESLQASLDKINSMQNILLVGIDVNDGLLTQPGEQVMTGKQAQAYARYRYGTKDGDFGRTNRQREVIQKIFEKLTDLSLIELATLAAANYENVYTNLTLQDITLLAPAMLSLKDANFEELRIPVDGGYQFKTIDGMSIILCDAQKTWDAIADFLLEE